MEYLWKLTYLGLRPSSDAIFFGKDFFEILIFSLMPDLTPLVIPLTPTLIPCLELYAFLSRDFLFIYFSLDSNSSASRPSRL